ncbi:MAG TPA: hypothetical protein VNK89_04520 [Thermoflexus sp.]|nr:hypothetical protein [Thermoflexus sp.]
MSSAGTQGNQKLWWLVGTGLFLGALIACLCVGVFGATILTTFLGTWGWIQAEARPAQEVAEQFLTALREGRWESAYALCAPGFQEELRGPEALAQAYGGAYQPAEWSFRSWRIQRQDGVGHAQLGGTITTASQETYSFEIELVTVRAESGEVWRVRGFKFPSEGFGGAFGVRLLP